MAGAMAALAMAAPSPRVLAQKLKFVNPGIVRKKMAFNRRSFNGKSISREGLSVRAEEEMQKNGFFGTLQRAYNETKIPKLDEDESPEALRLRQNLDLLKAASNAGDADLTNAVLGNVFNATKGYLAAKFVRMTKSKALKEGLPSFVTLANGIFVLVFLRIALPRLLTMKTAGDFSEIAELLGLPGKDELTQYSDVLSHTPFYEKLLLFQAIWIVDKIFMLSEILPLSVVLPSISPLLFGGVLEGTLITSACATVGAAFPFLLGKNVFQKQVGNFSLFGSAPVREQKWFQKLNRKVADEPFKSALLIRLAPILPIPIDAHWYVCGVTMMQLQQFLLAYFIGTTKVAFIDASMGSLLLSSMLDSAAMQEKAKYILISEVVLVLLVSAVVTNIATKFVTDLINDDDEVVLNEMKSDS